MSIVQIDVQTIADELESLSGEELFALRREEETNQNKRETEHDHLTGKYWRQNAAIRLLLKAKCIDDTGNHEWVRDNYPYAELHCKKCLVGKR